MLTGRDAATAARSMLHLMNRMGGFHLSDQAIPLLCAELVLLFLSQALPAPTDVC